MGAVHQLEASSLTTSPPPLLTTANVSKNNYKSSQPPKAMTSVPVVKRSLALENDATTCLSTSLSIPTLINMPNTEVVVAGSFSSSASTNSSITTATSPGAVPTSSSSISSNDSKPVRDLKLEAALNGQEPTVRNLIMAAIGVMKNRKVRSEINIINEK